MQASSKRILSDLGLLYAAAIWGSTFVFVKASLEFVDPTMLVAYRFLLAAILLAIALIFMGKPLFQGISKGFVLGFVLWALYVPQTIGLRYTSASNSGFITGLFVAFLPLLYFLFYRKAPPVLRQLAVLISLIGLWLLTGGMNDLNIGDMLTIGAAVAYAFHILIADKLVKEGIDPLVLSFQQFFTVGLLSLISGFIFGLPLGISGWDGAIPIILLAIFPTISAFVIQLMAQRHTSPVKVSLIFASEPLFAAIFAWTWGGEIFVPIKALGGLFIVAAIIISELPTKKGTKQK